MSGNQPSTEFHLEDLEVGDKLNLQGDDLRLEVIIVRAGKHPGCIFHNENNAISVGQILGTVGFTGCIENALDAFFDGVLTTVGGLLVYTTAGEGTEIHSEGSLTEYTVERNGTIIAQST